MAKTFLMTTRASIGTRMSLPTLRLRRTKQLKPQKEQQPKQQKQHKLHTKSQKETGTLRFFVELTRRQDFPFWIVGFVLHIHLMRRKMR
jgi:hypothetical protein